MDLNKEAISPELHKLIEQAEGDAEGDRDTWLMMVAHRAYQFGLSKQAFTAQPVAWMTQSTGAVCTLSRNEIHEAWRGEYTIPLYTTPHPVALDPFRGKIRISADPDCGCNSCESGYPQDCTVVAVAIKRLGYGVRVAPHPVGKPLTDEEIERIGVDIETELESADWPRGSIVAEVENFKRYAKRLRPYLAPCPLPGREAIREALEAGVGHCLADALDLANTISTPTAVRQNIRVAQQELKRALALLDQSSSPVDDELHAMVQEILKLKDIKDRAKQGLASKEEWNYYQLQRDAVWLGLKDAFDAAKAKTG
jgi:hypothetical protein